MIVLMTTSLGWGGTEGHVIDLAIGYVRRGIYPIVIADSPPLNRMKILQSAGVKVEVLSHIGKFSSVNYKVLLTKLLRDVKPTLLHINAWERRVLIMEVATDLGIPFIETIHATVEYKLRYRYFITRYPLSLWRATRAYKKANPAVINISDLSNINFKKKYPFVDRTRRIYCGAYLPSKSTDVYHSGKSPTVLWIGSLIKRKRPLLALEIWKKIMLDFPGAQLILIGDGPERCVVEEAAKECIENSIVMTGNVIDLYPMLLKADIVLNTSTAEGIPKNLRYAMNFGIPIMSTNVGAISEVVVDGENGFLIDVDDKLLMENRLRQLMSNPALRKKIGMAGRQTGEKLFNMESMIDNVLNAYRRLCGVQIESMKPVCIDTDVRFPLE